MKMTPNPTQHTRHWTGRKTAILSILALSNLFALGGGCPYELTMYRDQYINNASQANLPSGAVRSGYPLELNVVLVYPKDLQRAENSQLRPGTGITSQDWFRRRPMPGDSVQMTNRGDRFWLPPEQILLLTDRSEIFGIRRGPSVRGSEYDPNPVLEFEFNGPAGSKESVIYVFGEFRDTNSILPVRPAMFHPPANHHNNRQDGKYKIAVRIGVDKDRTGGANYGQYIEVESMSSN